MYDSLRGRNLENQEWLIVTEALINLWLIIVYFAYLVESSLFQPFALDSCHLWYTDGCWACIL